ncbi:restriction endonuclease subunit S [Helicobacter pylori]|uniref:restriction endonuclease subunit S n=1 Tax=Helicobacter pylori TaxID=210 RepID=UPI0034658254
MLEKVFQEITNKRKFFASSSTGEQFENQFRNESKKHFSEINGDLTERLSHIEEKPNKEIKTAFNQLKKQVLEKNHPHTLKNPFSNLTSHFLYQPFGSQNYPDFLVFIFDHVVGIEIKFSKNDKDEKNLQTSRPMWNSNLPKPNAIYVYGVANADITFFKGSDILSYETREVLLKYFDTLDKDEGNLKNALKDLENPFGFAPYIRKAYEHKKEFSNHHQIESFFSSNHILTMFLQSHIQTNRNESNTPYIVMATLKDFEILLPPLNEQIAIANILSGLDHEIISLKNKKRQFENIKKALNHDLMSAKIRVLKKINAPKVKDKPAYKGNP